MEALLEAIEYDKIKADLDRYKKLVGHGLETAYELREIIVEQSEILHRIIEGRPVSPSTIEQTLKKANEILD